MYSASLNQQVRSLVERDNLSLPKNATVSDAVITMKKKGVSSVLVTSDYYRSSLAQPSEIESTFTTEYSPSSHSIEGIVTERDILYRVIADKKDPMKVTLGEIMSSPIIAVDEQLLLKDAISLMRSEHIRRLLVTTSQKIEVHESSSMKQEPKHEKGSDEVIPIGIVTLMSIAGNMPTEHLELAEVEIPTLAHGDSSDFGVTKDIDLGSVMIICPYCESKFDNKKDLSKHIDRIHLGSGLLEGDVRQW
jgi:CBS domain-containing protein